MRKAFTMMKKGRKALRSNIIARKRKKSHMMVKIPEEVYFL